VKNLKIIILLEPPAIENVYLNPDIEHSNFK